MPGGAAAEHQHLHDGGALFMKTIESQEERAQVIVGAGSGDVLRKSEARYRRLFETAHDGILILNAETGAIVDANPFLLDLLGYPFEDMVGKHLWEIGEFKDIAASKAAFATLQSTEYVRYENLPLQTRSGEQREVEFVSNVYDVDGEKVIQCNIREISARAKKEQAAKTHLVGLEIASEAKDNVLAIVSHELRTPLGAISSMLDLLDLRHPSAPMADQQKGAAAFDGSAVAHIRRNIQFLSRLTNQLFDFSHIVRGEIHLDLEVIDAHKAISEVLKNLEKERESKQIAIDLQLRALNYHVKADAVKFHQIVSNLIGNAIKFSPIGGKIDIATSNSSADQIAISIKDNGIGLEANDIVRIFSPYEQADSSIHPQYGGLGLGLSIARSLVEAHQGKLTAESRGKNQGATFTLEFKSTQAVKRGVALAKTKPMANLAALRILVVEDHFDARRCLARVLQSRGHLVTAAENARAALDLSTGHDFDLLIADVGLPDGNGWDLFQILKRRQPHLQAIALSGYGMPQDLLKSKAAGFAEYLVKPVDIETLDVAIGRSSVTQKKIVSIDHITTTTAETQ
jgi:PAS domain S-box-containing protein